LLLQPFIENAIWHGLLHKPKAALLSIRVSQTEAGATQISIRDNGAGRGAQRVQSVPAKGKKQSMGINLTLERIDISNCLYEGNISLEIIDLFDAQRQPDGTEVLLLVEN
ncbi:MAG: hypothetical protein KDC44_10045, partial [Phaeodactylibacter sp.]|nr:hypothetical protein [Phaeodactylibacter sp.]